MLLLLGIPPKLILIEAKPIASKTVRQMAMYIQEDLPLTTQKPKTITVAVAAGPFKAHENRIELSN